MAKNIVVCCDSSGNEFGRRALYTTACVRSDPSAKEIGGVFRGTSKHRLVWRGFDRAKSHYQSGYAPQEKVSNCNADHPGMQP